MLLLLELSDLVGILPLLLDLTSYLLFILPMFLCLLALNAVSLFLDLALTNLLTLLLFEVSDEALA